MFPVGAVIHVFRTCTLVANWPVTPIMLFRAANASLDDIWATTSDGLADLTDGLTTQLTNATDGHTDEGDVGAWVGGGVGGAAGLSLLITLLVLLKRNLELCSRLMGQFSNLFSSITNVLRREGPNQPPPLPPRTYSGQRLPRNLTDEEVVAARHAHRLATDAAGHHLYANVAYSEYV